MKKKMSTTAKNTTTGTAIAMAMIVALLLFTAQVRILSWTFHRLR